MATTTQKKRAIKYLNRDFESFKDDFIEHIKVYFPDTYQDFNESSVGMMLTELACFIGDNLSYYLDKKFEESFLETAREEKNIFKHAGQLGFKAFGKASAIGVVDGYLEVPAITENEVIIPDMRYAGTIKKGAKLKSNSGQTYETIVDMDFSNVDRENENFAQVGKRDPVTDSPTTFILKKTDIEIKAGETKSTTFSIGAYEAFKKVTIDEDDVLEIISIFDSEGNQWYEVDFLAQDTVFDGVANVSDDSDVVPFVLKLRSVPYRFISKYDISENRVSLIFGTGDAQSFDGELIPDLGDLSLPLYGRDTFTDFSLDPQNFLRTRTLGLAPVNTTLTVRYRVGGGVETNAGASEIATVVESVLDIGDTSLDANTIKDVGNSFVVLNPRPIQGGRDSFTSDEIKQIISADHATQSRIVTAADFVTRSLSMPIKFGSVFRVSAKESNNNENAIHLFVLSRDVNGYVVVAPQDLKKNLKKYLNRFRMITDAIEILDGEVINFAIKFEIVVNVDFHKNEVVGNCIEALKEYFEIEKWQINQPINKTSIQVLLGSIPGLLTLTKFEISNRVGNYDGRVYSFTSYNIKENTENEIIYCKDNAIFECKFPNKDIVGVAK